MRKLAVALWVLGACADDGAGSVDAGLDAQVTDGGDAQAIDGRIADAQPDGDGAAPRDASLDATMGAPARLSEVTASLERWDALAAAHPGLYWYEDENCRINAITGGSTLFEVDGGPAHVVATRSFPRSACAAGVNRYETMVGSGTMQDLHAACTSLLARRADTRFSLDDEGILRACWVPDEPNCKDNCGQGFYLLRRGFGPAPVGDAGL